MCIRDSIGTDKVVQADADIWTIQDVKITPYGVADPESRFLMQLKPGALTSICVADDGMLLAINKEVDAPQALPASPLPSRRQRQARRSPLPMSTTPSAVSSISRSTNSSARPIIMPVCAALK